MAMSWIAALNAQDQSLEAMLARQHLQQQGTLSLANALEDRRQQAEAERMRQQQLDESHQDRADAQHDRRVAVENELQRRKEAQVSLDEERKARAAQYARDTDERRAKEAADKRQHDMDMIKLRSELSLNQQLAVNAQKEKEKEEARHLDNPKLPTGVAAYLNSLPMKVKTAPDAQGGEHALPGPNGQPQRYKFEDALADINKNWPTLSQAHPNLDINEVGKALRTMFTQPALDRQVSGTSQEPVVMVRTDKGDTVPVPQSQVKEAVEHGGTVVQ